MMAGQLLDCAICGGARPEILFAIREGRRVAVCPFCKLQARLDQVSPRRKRRGRRHSTSRSPWPFAHAQVRSSRHACGRCGATRCDRGDRYQVKDAPVCWICRLVANVRYEIGGLRGPLRSHAIAAELRNLVGSPAVWHG